MVPIDVIAEQRGLFNARTGAGAHVDLELPRIDAGKEVLAERRRQQAHRANGENGEQDQKEPGVIDAQREDAEIAETQFRKARLECRVESG